MPRCPICKDQTQLIPYEGVKIHHCGRCGGYWLTETKLDAILARQEVLMPAAVQEAVERMALESNSTAMLTCITCGTSMRKQLFRGFTELQVDVCPRCHGIWFDRAELERAQLLWEKMKSDPRQLAKLEKQGAAEVAMMDELARQRQEAEDAHTLSEFAIRLPWSIFFSPRRWRRW